MMQQAKLNFLYVIPRITLNPEEGYSLPLGIPYVYSYQKRAGFNVFALNLNSYASPVSECISRAIDEHNIHVICTGGLSQMHPMITDITLAAKKHKPDIVTVVGGGIISSDPETAMQALDTADFGVIGEGEETMCELASALEAGATDYRRIAGLIYRAEHAYIKTAIRPDIKDLDALPFPDYGAFDIERIIERSSRDGRGGAKYEAAVAIVGSRSCPYRCTFCFHTSGKKYRQRSLNNLFSEIDVLVSKYHVKELLFSDELFAASADRVKEFCERISRYDLAWSCAFRPDQISPDLIDSLKKSRIKMVGLGLESYDDRVLKSMRKGITSKDIDRALELLYAAEIPVSGQFILGDLEETMESATKTLNYCRAHLQYHINLSFIRPFPGTYIYQQAVERGIIPDKVQYLKDGCPQINISHLTDDEFSEILHQMDTMYQGETSEIADIEITATDASSGCVDFTGICTKCGSGHAWTDVNICSNGFLFCPACKQKFNIPHIPAIFSRIDDHIRQLLDTHGKAAIWAITNYVSNYVASSTLRHDKRLFLIDTSKSKQKLVIDGKPIHDPAVINREKIPVVIVGAAAQTGLIESVIRNNHPDVVTVTVLGNLIGTNEGLEGVE